MAEIRYVKMIKTEKLKAIKALPDDKVLNELTGISFNERKKLYYIELKKNNLLRKHWKCIVQKILNQMIIYPIIKLKNL